MTIPLIVVTAAKQAGISAMLLFSVCNVESGMVTKNSFHDGHGRGSMGICQVSVEVARMYKPYADRLALQQPGFNLLVSAMYLKHLQDKYDGTMYDAISAYNAGSVFVKEGAYKNQKYVDKVLKVYYNIGITQ